MRIMKLVVALLLVQLTLAIKECDESMPFSDLRMKGMIAGTKKNVDEAERCFEMALRKNASSPDVQHMLGMVYGFKEKWEQAEQHLQEAVRLDPQHIKAWKLLDQVLQAQKGKDGILDKLYTVAENFARIEPDNPEAFAYVGFRAAQLQNFDKALSAFKTAYRMAPTSRSYLTNLLTVYATKGWLDEAVPFYIPLLKEEGDEQGDTEKALVNNAAHYFLLGNVFWAEGFLEQAIAYMSSAYERRPGCHAIRFQLGKFLYDKALLLSKLIGDEDAQIDGTPEEKTKAVLGMALEQLCMAMYMAPTVKYYSHFLKNISKIDECSSYVDVHDSGFTIKAIVSRKYWLHPIDAVDPPGEMWQNERCTSYALPYARVLSAVTPSIPFPADPIKHYLINLGAGDGVNNDQLYELYDFEKNHGLVMEGNPKLFEKLQENLPDEEIVKVNAYPSTSTVVNLFKQNKVPKEPSILKLTIDGMECPVMEKILGAGYKPKVVVMKINPSIPPPIRFSLKPKETKGEGKPADDGFQWNGNPYYGCSLSYASDIMTKHGYTLLQLDWVYAVYVQDSWMWKFEGLAHDDFSVHFTGFHGREDRLRCIAFRSSFSGGDPLKGAQMHINFPEMERWYVETDQSKQLEMIKTFMDSVQHDVPYVLQVDPVVKNKDSK